MADFALRRNNVGYRWAALSSFGLLVSIAQPASAATELAGATLVVDRAPGAEDCPDAESLRIRTLDLGTPRERPSGHVEVSVGFTRDDAGYRATVQTVGRGEGTRELLDAGATCGPLATAASLVLAVILDLRPREEVTPPPPRDAPEPRPPSAQASAPERSLFRFAGLGAHASGAYGLLGPGLSASFGGDARLRFSFLELAVGGFGALNRTIAYSPGSVEVSVAAGSAGLCAYPVDNGVELGACASFLVGQIHAEGRGFFGDSPASSLWLASRVGATLTLPLARHWVARLGADLVVPLGRYSLVVERAGTVYDPSPVGFSLTFGPEVRFL